MRLVIQRVLSASLSVEGVTKGSIKRGLVVFVGFGRNDSQNMIEPVVRKILKLRIFADNNDKMNLNIGDVNGGLIVVSQFTLYANTKGGNRPDFLAAMNPEQAKILFDRFVESCRILYSGEIIAGDFGKHMVVDIQNDGPVTLCLNYENQGE